MFSEGRRLSVAGTCDVCVFSGDTPAEVELMYLENAQMLAQYGIHMYPAKVSHTLLILLLIIMM